jgi:hypothetical protein
MPILCVESFGDYDAFLAAQAWPSCYYCRSSVVMISLVGVIALDFGQSIAHRGWNVHRQKYGRSISLCEGCLDYQCRLPVEGRRRLLSRCVLFPFFLEKSKCQAHIISGSISGWSEAPLEAQTWAQTRTSSRGANPTFSTSTVFTMASRELEYDAHTVRDGTAD